MNNDKKVFVDINNAGGRKPLMEKLQKSLDTGEDPFAPEHIAKYHKKPIIKSGTWWYITESESPYPAARHHFLAIATEYWETLQEIVPEGWTEIGMMMKELCEEYAIPGGGFFFRFGDTELTGATVKRLHVHLIVPEPGAGNILIPLGRKKE